jgi:hypothetical protein
MTRRKATQAAGASAPLRPTGREPRLRFALLFNRADYLRQLGRLPEGEALVPAVRALASRLGNDLDLVRLTLA